MSEKKLRLVAPGAPETRLRIGRPLVDAASTSTASHTCVATYDGRRWILVWRIARRKR